ncbi:MAG: TOBE domain-containing protein [Actinomycetaceae bacterium]|nr:TOBE domain-containing protein [Actinomycetaceae bacterium]
MKLSARNQLPGKVVSIEKGAVTAIVQIEVAPGLVITSSVTNDSVDNLGLTVGSDAYAVIKASAVMLGTD